MSNINPRPGKCIIVADRRGNILYHRWRGYFRLMAMAVLASGMPTYKIS